MARRTRTVVIVLQPDEWDRLREDAERDMRDPWQHARYLLLRALPASHTPPTEEAPFDSQARSGQASEVA